MTNLLKELVLSHHVTAPPSVKNFVTRATNTTDNELLIQILQYICRTAKQGSSSTSSLFKSRCAFGGAKIPQDVNVSRVLVNQQVTDTLSSATSGSLACLFVVILLAALLGNCVVLGTLVYNKSSWTGVDISTLSLSVSDVLVSTMCIPLFLDQVTRWDWSFGSLSCRTIPFFMNLGVSANMLTLCCLAVDRYLAVVYPLKFNTFKSVKTTQVLLLLAWIVALGTSAPSAFRYDVQVLCGKWMPDGTCHQDYRMSMCMRTGQDDHLVSKHTMMWISFVVLFLCPTLVIGLAYGIIIYTLWVKATVGIVALSMADVRNRYKRKAVKMLVCVVVLFILSWAPLKICATVGIVALSMAAVRNRYKRKAVKMLVCVVVLFILSWAPLKIWFLVSEEGHVYASASIRTVDFYLKCLAISSTAYNPIIYAFMNQKFRANFKNIIHFRKKFVRVAPHLLINESPECGDRKHKNHPHCPKRQHLKNSPGLDGEDSPTSNNNNNTTAVPGSAPKTTSTKLTMAGSTRQIVVWSSQLDVRHGTPAVYGPGGGEKGC